MDAPQIVKCRLCGDRIGVYEPIVVVDRADGRVTSRLREPELDLAPDSLLHASCAERAGITLPPAPGLAA